ncbi:MAG: DUF5320 domain-containing protein [Proteobacteria bacterium]|nr:DUF5320 domain-containing protein [Pseudomonadota bacterium]
MPGFNKKGPMGQGPRTGRGLGLCTGEVTPEKSDTRNDAVSRGVGRGGSPWGGGRGRCFGGGRRRRGMGRRSVRDDSAKGSAGVSDQIARLIEDNEELRAKLAKLESKQEE